MGSTDVRGRDRNPITSYNRAVGLKLLLCSLALGLVAAAQAQPFPSFLLDTSIVIGPDPNGAEWTSVAFGNQRGLVVWTDGRIVKGCRFTRSLVPLDTPGLPLSWVTSTSVSRVDVASCQDTFLAVWAGDGGLGPVMAGALVSETDTEVRRVTLDSSDMCHEVPAVAANDSGFLIAWSEYDTSGPDRTRYARVSRSGVVVDTAVRLVANHRGLQYLPDIAWGDTSYLVVWVGWRDGDTGIFCNIVRRDGTRASDSGFLVSREHDNGSPVLSYDGRSFVVAWKRFVGTGLAPTVQIRVARVSPDGVVTDSAFVAFDHDGIGQVESMWNAIASVRDTTLFVWESLRDSARWAFGVRLDSSLRTLDSTPIALSTPIRGEDDLAPAGFSSTLVGDTFLVSWAGCLEQPKRQSPGREVVCRSLTPRGVSPETAAVMMSRAASAQGGADVASDGSDFMAVWWEGRTDSSVYDDDICYTRFSSSGTVLGSVVSLAGHDVRGPAIGYGGGCYLVVWGDGPLDSTYQDLAVRINRDGVIMDTVPILVARGEKWIYGGIDIGYVDSTFLIALQCNYPDWHIYGSRVSCNGRLQDSVPFVFPPDEPLRVRRNPGVASDGDSTFIVTRFRAGGGDEATFVRCTSGGVILDSAEVPLGEVPGTLHDVWAAPVRGPGEYFIVSTTGAWQSIAWRVSYAGTILDTIWDVYPFPAGTEPVFDGTNYVVANRYDDAHIGAQVVRPDGTVINERPVQVVEIDTNASYFSDLLPKRAVDDQGVTAVVFGTYEQERYGSRRARAAVWPLLGVEEGDGSWHRRSLSVYPNPVAGAAMLELGGRVGGPIHVSLYDVEGRLVKTLADTPAGVSAAQIPVDLGNVPAGVYFVNVHPTGTRTKIVLVNR